MVEITAGDVRDGSLVFWTWKDDKDSCCQPFSAAYARP
jgi:hypothetical protein